MKINGVLRGMSTKRVTLDDALDGLRKAVAEKGYEYLYGAEYDVCRYAIIVGGEARPACIVGHALVYLGVPADALAQKALSETIFTSAWHQLSELGYAFDALALSAFCAAQRVQDSSFGGDVENTSWGAALAAAERFAGAKSDGAS